MGAAEVARDTGQRPARITGYLTVLAERDLVACRPGLGWVPTSVDIEDADQGPLAGLGARRTREHRVQALVWDWLRAEMRFMRMSLEDKRTEARAGRRRQPYGQGQIGELTGDSLAQLRYPRRAVAILPGADGRIRTKDRLDHAEAARVVRLRMEELAVERTLSSPAARPRSTGAAWDPDLTGAPDFAVEGVRVERTRRRQA